MVLGEWQWHFLLKLDRHLGSGFGEGVSSKLFVKNLRVQVPKSYVSN